jgi:Putative transposase/Transposase zinc-binding domain
MTRPRLEVADVLRAHGDVFLDAYGDTLSPEQRRVLVDLPRCRTAALGGHVEACDQCGHQQVAYNSCRNRHCPKCQATEAARWVEARAADLLPVEYFHVVFTLPAALGPIALQNPRVVYDLLFHAAAETLLQIAADPDHLGAEIGLLAVLHTWGQTLQHHPHVHCVVPGGGPSPDGSRWVACPDGFFLPVKVLGRVFRGKFLAGLGAAFGRGELAFHGKLAALADADAFRHRLDAAARTDWVVYAQPPFGGPGQVLKYLARYTHRVAISNHRLLDLEGNRVQFRYKDYARGGKQRTMALEATEFLRRFLQHVLPAGFVRIRAYGLLANRHRREKLAACRALLNAADRPEAAPPEVPSPAAPRDPGPGVTATRCATVCPVCGVGRMVIIEELPAAAPRVRGIGRRPVTAAAFDTS